MDFKFAVHTINLLWPVYFKVQSILHWVIIHGE